MKTSQFLIVVLIVVLMFVWLRKRFMSLPDLHLRYHLKDARVFRNNFTEITTQPASQNQSIAAKMDLTTFPLFNHQNQIVGMLESNATLFTNRDQSADVFQNLNYVLGDGIISARLYFRNNKPSIFPDTNATQVRIPIVSGTGKYAHMKGNVEITVNPDESRDLVFRFE